MSVFLRSYEPEGPPEEIEEIGETMHSCEDQLARDLESRAGWWDVELRLFPALLGQLEVCRCTNERVPHFNARIFLENKEHIGNVDVPWPARLSLGL